jgi:RNA polymerase sigma-70 factor, ECF subfamily
LDRAALHVLRAQDDLRLAARCVSGDRTAHEELFAAQRLRVHATLFRILGSNADMEDLIQESFLEIFRSLGNFRGEAVLATWVDRVTARVAYAHLTRKGRRRTAHLELVPDVPDGAPSAEGRAASREAARAFYGVLEGIEAKQRIAFTLHVIDGRPLREVAGVMEASLVATKVRVWRARREIERRARREPALAGFLEGGTGTGPEEDEER